MKLISVLNTVERHSDDNKVKLQSNVAYLEKLIALIANKLKQGER